MTDFGLYPIITAPKLPYRIIAEICVDKHIRLLQLREKELSDRQVLRAADEILSVTGGSETGLIINDRADLALLCGAGGVHLGQEDLPLELGRRIYGGKPGIWGLSTHSPKQARAALELNPDYIAYGPIFPTPTKKKPDPTAGLDFLEELISLAEIPVVAIGGLFPETLDPVLEAGVRNLCLVRHFMECGDEDRLGSRMDAIIGKLEAAA